MAVLAIAKDRGAPFGGTPSPSIKGSTMKWIKRLLNWDYRGDLYLLYLCWKERGKWQWAPSDGEWTSDMTIWEVFKDKYIQICPLYPDHLTGNPDGCLECQCKAHDERWYDMDTGYVRGPAKWN